MVLPRIEGIKASVFFHKDEKKRTLAILASCITEDQRHGRKKSATSYEIAAQRGALGTLQKFLGEDDCETTRDGKLFNAYKLALVASDEFFRSLTYAVDWERPLRFRRGIRIEKMTDGELSQLLWILAGVDDFAYFMSLYALTPPTLASVRDHFDLVYPQHSGLWPNDKDVNHDMARKFGKWKLPLTRGKAGRPRNRGKLQK